MELEALLKDGMKELSVTLGDREIERFFKYKELLLEWNEKINLTAIEDEKDIIIKHFIDSATIASLLPEQGSIIDIGTGAGFPGIPLKILFERYPVTLLDSLEKRIKFLDTVIKELDLQSIRSVHGRAEDFGVNSQFREKFEVAVARAVAAMPVLLEYCLPFVKTGGVFIAMKGSNTEEVEQSKKALSILGGEIEQVRELTLPFSDMKRNIIVVRKLRQTPTKYPRKAGKPSKEPML